MYKSTQNLGQVKITIGLPYRYNCIMTIFRYLENIVELGMHSAIVNALSINQQRFNLEHLVEYFLLIDNPMTPS